jgi:glycosyltransferase involved in cell wall biosynthesis
VIANSQVKPLKKVKILHIITHLGIGGALDNTLLTVEGLSRDNYEVDLAAGHLISKDGYTDWEQRSRKSADSFFEIPDLVRPLSPLRDMRALKQLTQLIKERDYQIVHTHCSKAGVLGRMAARRAGVPVVVHTYHAFGWQVLRSSSPDSAFRRPFTALKKRAYVSLERYAASLSDSLVTVAEINKHQALEHRLAPADKFTTIYSGIAIDKFHQPTSKHTTLEQLGLEAEKPVIGLIGRLTEQKAPLDFVAAAKQVLKKHVDAQFIICGEGPLLQEIKQAIGDEGRIKILGFRDDVPAVLGVLDLLVVSSLWEGLGRSLTEAMIMGVPVVATAVDGIPELVQHRKTGLLSPPADVGKLSENIDWVLTNPKDAQIMADRAKSEIQTEFCSQRMVAKLDSLYQALLHKRGLCQVDHSAAKGAID